MEAGNMYEMYGVAAGVIGGISPLGGTGLLLGTFAGAAVWQTLENGLNMIGAQVGIQRLVIGIIVVFSVLLDVVMLSFVPETSERKHPNKTEKNCFVSAAFCSNSRSAVLHENKQDAGPEISLHGYLTPMVYGGYI